MLQQATHQKSHATEIGDRSFRYVPHFEQHHVTTLLTSRLRVTNAAVSSPCSASKDT